MAEQTQNSTAPGAVCARLDGADWWCFGVTSALTFVGYLLTLTPEITLDWSGILTTGAMYGGVGPPAGYPAWTIYSWLFIKLLPFSNPAWRVAVGSAVAAAISCGLVALMVSRGGKMLFAGSATLDRLTVREQHWIRGMSGYAAGMALGFSDSFWHEALVADFVTFTVLLFAIIIYLWMSWMETGRRRLCWLVFFIYGLLLTDSQEMITALPGLVCAILLIDRKFGRDLCLAVIPTVAVVTSITQYTVMNVPTIAAFSAAMVFAIVSIVATRKVGSEWKSAAICTLCFLLGFATYLYLPAVSATNPPVNWAYPRTLDGFIHLIARGQYEHVQPANSLAVFAPELYRFIAQTCCQFGWLYVALAVLPLCFVRRMTGTAQKWMFAMLLISLCVGPLLAALLNVPSDRQSQEIVEAYFFPFRVPLAVWTGMGLIFLATKTAMLGRVK